MSDYQEGHAISLALKKVADNVQQCPALLFNVYMAKRTWSAPLLLTETNSSFPTFVQQTLWRYSLCLNRVRMDRCNEFYSVFRLFGPDTKT